MRAAYSPLGLTRRALLLVSALFAAIVGSLIFDSDGYAKIREMKTFCLSSTNPVAPYFLADMQQYGSSTIPAYVTARSTIG